jgi:CPA1 family monovalent cation:H+ antiporter
MPGRIKSILSGESTINDATGIVSFQFALAAAATGSFNVFHGLGRFVILALGGLLVGIIITIFKFALVKWLRSLHIIAPSLHIAIGILTPFLIYIIAEELGTSGILAVFGAAIVHALYKDRFNPEAITLNNANENIWSFLSFSLDGLVFVVLGTQLPGLVRLEIGWASGLGGWQIVGDVLLIYLALVVTRFIWWLIAVRPKVYSDPKDPIGIIRSGLIVSVAGARGAVSMATILSIPLLLANGEVFPQRDLIILITCGVITVSMLMTNFVMPLLVKKSAKSSLGMHEDATRLEILQTVVDRLKDAMTPENHAATEVIIYNYYTRMNKYPMGNEEEDGKKKHFHIRSGVLRWERDVVLHLAETGQINESKADHYIEEMDRLYDESGQRLGPIQTFLWIVRHLHSSITWKESKSLNREIRKLRELDAQHMRQKRRDLHLAKDDPAYAIIAAEHEKVASARLGLVHHTSEDMVQEVIDVAENGLYIEHVLIQQMMEAGRLSAKTAKEMQANIILLEAQLHAEK